MTFYQEKNLLDISWSTIFKISLAIIGLYLLYSIKSIFVLFLFAITISVLFNPAINFLQKKKIPRVLAALLVYLGAIAFVVILVYLTIPIFKSEIGELLKALPSYYQKLSPFLRSLGLKTYENFNEFLKSFNLTLQKMSESFFDLLSTIFGGFSSFAFIFATAFFISIEEKAIERTLIHIFPKKYEYHVLDLWNEAENKISRWFGAKILCCLFVGILTFFSLLIFEAKYPAILGVLVGFLNFFPYIGVIIGGALIFLLTLASSPFKAFILLLIFIIIQQIEGNVLSPYLMRKFMNVPPALILISLVVGGKLWGFWGALLAIPLFSVIFEFLREFLKKKREKEAEALG